MNDKKLSKTLSGVAGEYFVAAELSRRGNIASITLRNTKGVDILAADEGGSKTAMVQVKTNKGAERSWMLNSKAEGISEDRLFYVFVALGGEGGVPSYHVVPSSVVAEYTATSHRTWLAGVKSDGSARKDTSMRKFNDPEGEYLDAWHLLGLE
jgi:hypothetical protein